MSEQFAKYYNMSQKDKFKDTKLQDIQKKYKTELNTERNSQNGYQAVVIRTNTTSSDVLLTLTGT